MLYGSVEQFQLYDQLLMQDKNWEIQNMVSEAAKALLKHINLDEKILIVCGQGNNGADGLALATLLKKNVIVYLINDNNNFSFANHYYQNKLIEMGIEIKTDFTTFENDIICSDVIVDGIFGTGFKGQLPKNIHEIIKLINQFKNKKQILSIDIPSGLYANTGVVHDLAITAGRTVTFIASKIGYLNPECHRYIGEVIIEEILMDNDLIKKVGFTALLKPQTIESLLKVRLYNGYKGSYGTLSCFVGSSQYPGAALISVGSALNTGCGIVQACCDEEIKKMVVQKYPEVVLTNQLVKRDAVLFGCGMGWNENTCQKLKQLIEQSDVPMLIDADGINCLSEHPEWLLKKKNSIILTPHIGEMKRLNSKDPILGAIEFARKYQVIIVLKGPHTMITDGHLMLRNPSGNKAMACAGMGDCLAGIIASLLAQHYTPLDAAVLGVYIHGYVGDTLAKDNYTVLPSAMIKNISKAMNEIKNKNQANT